MNLNFSPLFGVPNSCFISTVEDLIKNLKTHNQKTHVANAEPYFWINPELPLWKELLALDQKK